MQSLSPQSSINLAAMAEIQSYHWPGNILELKNTVERAILLAEDEEISVEHLPLSESGASQSAEGRLRDHVDNIERDAIIKALSENNNNQTHTAKQLGISRRALIYKLEKYGLKTPPKVKQRA